LLNEKIIFLTILLILILAPLLQAEEFKNSEVFTEYIYSNYAEENFAEVYENFAAELKRILAEEKYVGFQEQNFEKYNLEYTEIKVGEAQPIDFSEIKKEFEYAMDFGSYYQLQVSYLIKFNRFGSREERSEKTVYLRKINDDFQIFWDYHSAIDDEKAAEADDKDE